MSLPANYDFEYYIGDTKEFVVAPMSSGNQTYDLTGFTGAFVISNEKSPNPEWSVDGVIELNAMEGTVYCAIFPSVGLQLNQGTPYFYDVEIRKTVNGKEYVYTLLRGTITPVMGVNKSV